MRNVRTIFLILLAMGALVAAEVALDRRGAGVSSLRGTLAEIGSPVTEIEIVRRGAPGVRLEKKEAWQLVSPYRGAAHAPAVLKLVDALTLSPVSERISDSELVKLGRERSDFSLSAPHLKVTLKGSDGSSSTVSFGVPTPTADGVYAAVEGVDAVFIVPTGVFDAADATPDTLRRRSLFDLAGESVSELSIRRGGAAPVAFVRSGDGWRAGEKAASAGKLRGYVDRLVAAQAVSFVWPTGATNESDSVSESFLSGFGLDAENAVAVTLKWTDGAERRISFGKTAADGAAYALALDGTAVVTVPAALRDEAAQDPVHFTDTRLFPIEASSVAALTLTVGGTAYTLVRSGKDADWKLESPVNADADGEVISALLGRIVTLTSADADPAGVLVSLSSDAKPVGVAAAAVLPKGGVNAFRSKRVLKIGSGAVKRLVRTAEGKADAVASVVYSRERKAWNVEQPEGGGTVDAAAVAKVVAALERLVAVRIEKLKVKASDLDDYGLDKPWLKLAVDQESEGAIRCNLLVGKPAKGGRYATVGSTDAIFVLSDADVRALSPPLILPPLAK